MQDEDDIPYRDYDVLQYKFEKKTATAEEVANLKKIVESLIIGKRKKLARELREINNKGYATELEMEMLEEMEKPLSDQEMEVEIQLHLKNQKEIRERKIRESEIREKEAESKRMGGWSEPPQGHPRRF